MIERELPAKLLLASDQMVRRWLPPSLSVSFGSILLPVRFQRPSRASKRPLRVRLHREAWLKYIYWYHPPRYWDYLAFSERVTIQMAEQFEAEGIKFAAPALTVHLPPDQHVAGH